MKRLQLGAALLILSTSSYAWAESPEGVLGSPMRTHAKGAVAKAAPSGAPSGPVGKGLSPSRVSSAIGALKAEGASVTRGGAEMKVYREASPSVVLIVVDDGLGSGVLVGADGMIVTNLHVVGDADEVAVVFKPKQEGAVITKADARTAKVLRRDEVADLALIQVSEVPEGVKPLALGANDAVAVGADVHAIGHPTGESWTYTRGVISQIRKDYEWRTKEGRYKATVLQTQTPINPGNSGGPLLDDQLEVVGINSFKSEGEGMNFAVSADDVKAFLARPQDRMSVSQKRPVKGGECEMKSLEEWQEKKPKGTAYLLDADCDDKGDFIMVLPDRKKDPTLFLFDENEDGEIDSIIYDVNHDGDFDYGVYDTDGDGKLDMRGEFKNGETTPWRMERIDG